LADGISGFLKPKGPSREDLKAFGMVAGHDLGLIIAAGQRTTGMSEASLLKVASFP
jgi:hypothetical protein